MKIIAGEAYLDTDDRWALDCKSPLSIEALGAAIGRAVTRLAPLIHDPAEATSYYRGQAEHVAGLFAQLVCYEEVGMGRTEVLDCAYPGLDPQASRIRQFAARRLGIIWGASEVPDAMEVFLQAVAEDPALAREWGVGPQEL